MKVKEIARTANVAWSPSALQSIHLACGTVAQQLDATFRSADATNTTYYSFGFTETPVKVGVVLWEESGGIIKCYVKQVVQSQSWCKKCLMHTNTIN